MAFGRSANQKQLEDLCRNIGTTAVSVVRGTIPLDHFLEVASMQRPEMTRLYDDIASSQGSKAARKATREGIVIVELLLKPDWRAIRSGQDLVRGVLKSMMNGPVW